MKKRKRVSDIELPLPAKEEEAETRVEIRTRKGLSDMGARVFLNDLDAQGILRSKRATRMFAGMKVCTIVYWIEK